MIISLSLQDVAMKTLPVGTAYSIWVGVEAAGTVILGILLLGDCGQNSNESAIS
jgi:quaternary ammonium compound-resistance protein SugE